LYNHDNINIYYLNFFYSYRLLIVANHSLIALRPVSITSARCVAWRAIVTSAMKHFRALQRAL